MRILIVEDEFTSRMQLKYFLEDHGHCDIAVNGREAIEAFRMANATDKTYDLVCLDIKLPEKSGHEVLAEIRRIEEGMDWDRKAIVFMTTAASDIASVAKAYRELCDEYLTKPIRKEKLDATLLKHKLIKAK
jgi:two-component system chemotaxis response regulator CheY